MVKYGAPSMVSSGYVAKVDEANCTACGTCEDACCFQGDQDERERHRELGEVHGVRRVHGPMSYTSHRSHSR